MAKRTRAMIDQMLKEWAEARGLGVLDGLGWKGGLMAEEPTPRAQGRSKSNAAQAAELGALRAAGYADAVLVDGAMELVKLSCPVQVSFLQFRYLIPGSWMEQTRTLAKTMPGVTEQAYRAHVESALYLISAELIVVRDGDERTQERRQYRGEAR